MWGIWKIDEQAAQCRELRQGGACVVMRRKVVVVEKWGVLGTTGGQISPAAVTKRSDVDRA